MSLEEPQPEAQTGTSTSAQHRHLAEEDSFSSFEEDEEEALSSSERQVEDYFRCPSPEFNSLTGSPLIKKMSLRFNAAPPSSAPVERLFSLGKLVFSPKRNELSDKRLEKLVLLRSKLWFSST